MSASTGGSIKAIIQDRYGLTDVLKLEEIERPTSGDDDVLVRVRAAGVDMGVWHLMTGTPYLLRLFGFGLRKPKQRVRGTDVAGIVVEVGAKVTSLRVGDQVFGSCGSTFAEYVSAPANRFIRKPALLSFEQAAALPVSGTTALQGLRDAGKLEAGQRVLIVGAGGGVGSFAVQIAKAMGAEVTGVCSSSKLEFVSKLGADHVIDYTREQFADGAMRYDLILEMAGDGPVSRSRRALTERGTLVIGGGEGGGRWIGGTRRQLRAMLTAPFVRHRIRPLLALVREKDLVALCELVAAGKVMPAVDRTFALSEAAQAIDYVVAGKARGKVVVCP